MAAPKGNKFASHEKPWTDALRRVLAQLEVKDEAGKVQVKAGEALRQIAEVTVLAAIGGDKDARKEISDRLDGRPSEFVNVNHSRDPREMSTDELAAEILQERTGGKEGRAGKPRAGKEASQRVH